MCATGKGGADTQRRDERGSGLSVILVCRHGAFRRAASRFLESVPGVGRVMSTASPGDAVALAQDPGADLVVMELGFPVSEGRRVLRRIRTALGTPKVVVMYGGEKGEAPGFPPGFVADGVVSREEFATEIGPMLRTLFGGGSAARTRGGGPASESP